MFLSEPPESPYDLRFSLLGVPVRVAWTFWLVAVIFGYEGAVMIDDLFFTSSPSIAPWLVMWCAVMFVSILLHELGHALAFRMCGIHASIVLYHFGGLAIPTAQSAPGNYFARLTAWQGIFIAAAGPGVQLLLAAGVIGAVRLSGYALVGGPEFLYALPGVRGGDPIDDPGLFAFVSYSVFINVLWALLNLIPVWPLDGGRIAREVVTLSGGSTYQSLQLSMFVAGGAALWFFSIGQPFAAILFVSLAASSYQLLSSMGGWRF